MVRKSFVALSLLTLAATVPAALTACEVRVNEPKSAPSADPPPPAPPPDPTPAAKPVAAPMPQLKAIGKIKIEGDKVSIPGELAFDFGKFDINEKKEPNGSILTQLKDFLDQNPTVTKLRIEGHTDDVGKPEDNMKLSQQRADAVAKWLTAHGIVATRLHAVGFGETQPKVKNDSDANRAQNRRTEFHVEEVDGKPLAAAAPPPPPASASAAPSAAPSASASAKPTTSASASAKPATSAAASATPAASASAKK
jgi:outer membrane protein OmpA-like peptidoglycan-associated protein